MRNEFVSVLENFLEGSLSSSALQEWLLSRLQLILNSDDAAMIAAANMVDAAIVDAGECLITDEQFINIMSAAVREMRTFRFQTGTTRGPTVRLIR